MDAQQRGAEILLVATYLLDVQNDSSSSNNNYHLVKLPDAAIQTLISMSVNGKFLLKLLFINIAGRISIAKSQNRRGICVQEVTLEFHFS